MSKKSVVRITDHPDMTSDVDKRNQTILDKQDVVLDSWQSKSFLIHTSLALADFQHYEFSEAFKFNVNDETNMYPACK